MLPCGEVGTGGRRNAPCSIRNHLLVRVWQSNYETQPVIRFDPVAPSERPTLAVAYFENGGPFQNERSFSHAHHCVSICVQGDSCRSVQSECHSVRIGTGRK